MLYSMVYNIGLRRGFFHSKNLHFLHNCQFDLIPDQLHKLNTRGVKFDQIIKALEIYSQKNIKSLQDYKLYLKNNNINNKKKTIFFIII